MTVTLEQLEKARGRTLAAGWTLATLVTNRHPEHVLQEHAQRVTEAHDEYINLIAELAVHE